MTREAYSWGGMARSSIGSTSTLGMVLGTAGRVGWALLLPFGLVNVAYWSRRLDARPTSDPTRADLVPLTPAHRGGAGLLRFAGLLVTLLTATTASVLSLDFLGVQCFSGSAARCAALPSWSGFLYSWSLPRRLALLSAIPLALVLFLRYLATRSRERYEQATRDQTYGAGDSWRRTPEASRSTPRWPLLSTPGFWNHGVVHSRTVLIHVSAVGVLVAVATAWHMRFGAGSACRTVTSLWSAECRAQVARTAGPGGSIWVIGVAGVLLALLVALVVVHSEAAADVRAPDAHDGKDSQSQGDTDGVLAPLRAVVRRPLMLKVGSYGGAALFLVQILLLCVDPTKDPNLTGASALSPTVRIEMVGVSAVPAVILAVLLGVAFAALTLRYCDSPWPTVAGLVSAVALLVSGFDLDGASVWVARLVALAGAAYVLYRVARTAGGLSGPARRYEIWGGCGPGVALLLGQFLCLVLASAIVVAVGNVLNGTYSAASLARLATPAPGPADPCALTCVQPPDDFPLTAPLPYVWFGGLLVVAVGLLLLALAFAMLTLWVRRRGALMTSAHVSRDDLGSSPGARRRGGRPDDPVPADGPLFHALAGARDLAAHAHRAEKGAALIACVGALTIALSIGVAISDLDTNAGVVAPLMDAGMWVLGAVGLLVLGLATGAGDAVRTRPLGLIWDLICFLPRAGHPFGPPCYTERVVPELLGRSHWWLTEEGRRADDEIVDTPRRIVLSAHSLGGVLAVATVLGAPAPEENYSPVPHLSLLTYGCQLRAYFSRFFPELLGPAVLGSPPCRAAGALTVDPWQTDKAGGPPAVDPAPRSVRGLLGGSAEARGRWINLWRLTDYLVFPVHHYPSPGEVSPFDRYAEEVDRTEFLLDVVSHGEYPRSVAYSRALSDLGSQQG